MNDNSFYDPSEVRLITNGIDITGFSDGEKIKIEPVTKENVKSHAGVDGDVSFTKVHDPRHTITFNLKQGSPSNVVLEGFLRANVAIAAQVINKSEGKYIGGGINGRIAEKPAIGFGAEETKREWKILVADYSGSSMS